MVLRGLAVPRHSHGTAAGEPFCAWGRWRGDHRLPAKHNARLQTHLPPNNTVNPPTCSWPVLAL